MNKSFREYLVESKKVFSFKIKIAGELPDNFIDDFKANLDRYRVLSLQQTGKTPIQKLPVDFPDLTNKEVHIIELICEYPVTQPEISQELISMGILESCFRVRGCSESIEYEQQILAKMLEKEKIEEVQPIKIDAKDYFGDDFNKSFLKDLAKTAKEQKKDGTGPTEYKMPKHKQDKSGTHSAIGSK